MIHETGLFRSREHAIAQLNRWYVKLYDSFGDGGSFGWDMPTLRTVNPAGYNSLMRLYAISRLYRS